MIIISPTPLTSHSSGKGFRGTVAVISFMHYRNLRNERIRKENETYLETFNFDEDNPLLDEPKKAKKKSKKERKAEKE